MNMPAYKDGKQEHILSFEEIKQKVNATNLSKSEEAYFWLLYWCGVRKSEAYERVVEDFEITSSHLIVDFGQRKKHSAKTDPLAIPLSYYGINKIVEAVQKARERRVSTKSVFVQIEKKRMRQRKKGKWVFPNIQSTKAWQIIKNVLGPSYYPHFLRLNRLSVISSDPTTSLTRLKSFSGIKSIKSLSAYLGMSKREQQKAIEISGKEAGQTG